MPPNSTPRTTPTLSPNPYPGMPRFQSKAQELHAHLSDFAQQQFGEWVELVESELRDEP